MAIVSFSSQPVSQDGHLFKTELSINDGNAHVAAINLYRDSQLFYSIPTQSVPIFTIRFDLFDLMENKMTGDSVTYSPDNRGSVGSSSGNRILFTSVKPSPEDIKPPPEAYGNINVRLTFTAATGTGLGWLDLDIDFTYPPTFKGDATKYAWQPTLIFPRIAVAKDRTADGDSVKFRDYSLLAPFGEAGQMGEIASLTQRMVTQYASLYKTVEAQPKSYAQGFALMATDVLGHQKDVVFDGRGEAGELAFQLISPIFLKNKSYVSPSFTENNYSHSFWLTRDDGTRYGYGGAYTHYWLRAFHVENPHAGVPADWRNVADLYRNYVSDPNSGRRIYFYDKKPARSTTAGPLNNFSPHTVVSNYALEGPVSAGADAGVSPEWLEVHPMKPVGSNPDVLVNKNESVLEVLARIKAKVNNPAMRLEVQLWGFEMGGFYHYYGGYPPITDVLNGDPQRFKNAMRNLKDAGFFATITTDPIAALVNRYRFAGHLFWKGQGKDPTNINDATNWLEFIQSPFPQKIIDGTCGVTKAGAKVPVDATDKPPTITALKRVFVVKDDPGAVDLDPMNYTENKKLTCTDVPVLFKGLDGSERIGADGKVARVGGPLSNPFYGQELGALCVTDEVERRYRDEWLVKVRDYGARLIELMKIWGFAWNACYNKNHQHILPRQSTDLAYDNVIGVGPWAIKRLQALCTAAQNIGRTIDPNSFSLTIEAAPLEPLLPYVDEFYHSSPLFQYVYSEVITTKMDLGLFPPYIQPGYKEQRKTEPPNNPAVVSTPEYMVSQVARDFETHPDLNRWRVECAAYFNGDFKILRHGLAPRLYPTAAPASATNPAPNYADTSAVADPLAPTNPTTYTYCRGFQDVFNLRARIFDMAARAVAGERVFLSSYIFEKTSDYDAAYTYYDYNEELINVMKRAINMHIQHASFFLRGRMIGKTAVTLLPQTQTAPTPENLVRAWVAPFRPFQDVQPLRNKQYYGRNPNGVLSDLLSLGYDKDYPFLASYERLPHMIWRNVFTDGYGYIYVFANVGNSPLMFNFKYTHGFEGGTRWRKIIRVFDGNNTAGRDPSGVPETQKIEVRQGDTETIFQDSRYALPARSFAAINVVKY